MGPRIDAELADDALRTAIARRGPAEGRARHSDHGAQCVSVLLSKTMRENGIMPSMGAVRSPWDNAAMESLMGAVESEGVHARARDGRGRAELDPLERIERACNRVRIHSALGYVSPADFEKANWPEEEKSRPMAE
jgi:transposase InsO family protein